MKSTTKTKNNISRTSHHHVRIIIGLIIIFILALTSGVLIAKFYQPLGFGAIQGSNSANQTLQGIANFRTVSVPGKMKANILFRSTRLSNATPSDAQYLAKVLKNGIVIDLRTAIERRLSPDRPIPSVANKSFPITGAASADSYVAAFVNDANDRANLAKAFTAVANANGPVLIHCTYGKDRTGWLVALIMYSLGANDQQIMTEYLRSNAELKHASVSASWLQAALTAARQKYGSIDNYIREGLGVSDDALAKLKAKFAV